MLQRRVARACRDPVPAAPCGQERSVVTAAAPVPGAARDQQARLQDLGGARPRPCSWLLGPDPELPVLRETSERPGAALGSRAASTRDAREPSRSLCEGGVFTRNERPMLRARRETKIMFASPSTQTTALFPCHCTQRSLLASPPGAEPSPPRRRRSIAPPFLNDSRQETEVSWLEPIEDPKVGEPAQPDAQRQNSRTDEIELDEHEVLPKTGR